MEGTFLVQYGNIKKNIKCSKDDIQTECQFQFDLASKSLHFEFHNEEKNEWIPIHNLEELPLKARLKLHVQGIHSSLIQYFFNFVRILRLIYTLETSHSKSFAIFIIKPNYGIILDYVL